MEWDTVMTNKLYYESAYLKEWQTKISRAVEKDDGLYLILEETAFYPHGGGQPCDTGFINELQSLMLFWRMMKYCTR